MEREVKDSSRGPICGQVAVCLRKRGSIKSTYKRPAQKVGGRDARRMARRLVDGARVDADGLDASEKPISKSDSILGPEGRNDGDGGTKEAAAKAAERPARIIASSALHCPDSANSMSAPPGSKMRVRTPRLLWMCFCCNMLNVFAVSPVQSWVRLFSFQA